LVVGNVREAARELKSVAPPRTTGERAKFDCGLQASCKHRASAAMSPVPPKCSGSWANLARSPHFGGTRRNACTRSKRLITRRSQVQILPRYLEKTLVTGPFLFRGADALALLQAFLRRRSRPRRGRRGRECPPVAGGRCWPSVRPDLPARLAAALDPIASIIETVETSDPPINWSRTAFDLQRLSWSEQAATPTAHAYRSIQTHEAAKYATVPLHYAVYASGVRQMNAWRLSHGRPARLERKPGDTNRKGSAGHHSHHAASHAAARANARAADDKAQHAQAADDAAAQARAGGDLAGHARADDAGAAQAENEHAIPGVESSDAAEAESNHAGAAEANHATQAEANGTPAADDNSPAPPVRAAAAPATAGAAAPARAEAAATDGVGRRERRR
jgi:hypothetical protein